MDLHHYYKENKDQINSSIMEVACDLATARLMNVHQAPFEAFVEPDDSDDPDSGTRYKEEFQDEFDKYYGEEYERVAVLMRFDPDAIRYRGGWHPQRRHGRDDRLACLSCERMAGGGPRADRRNASSARRTRNLYAKE
ncbi:hypothetical protein [Alistipes ihumii]|uniref:hypothetical protein n=1 Tax=Alistipes ihumii TaxID=1470347 RepID=UPI003AB8F0B3